ncbi:MAG: HNH endonuclease [Candidatus Aenigmarchaeota archaeon]|nr:HNH endonuclease [Candidatus Aenigmarchaeota archaeon]
MIINCRNCKYEWGTKTKLNYASCPNCGTKNQIPHYNVSLKAKKELRERAGNKCEECGSKVRLEIHHIVTRQQGNLNELSNLKLLCHKCHAKKGISNRISKNRKQVSLNITFEEEEYSELQKEKKDLTWHDFILKLTKLGEIQK